MLFFFLPFFLTMQWRLSYTQKCIICMVEGSVNSTAALFSESTSSEVNF